MRNGFILVLWLTLVVLGIVGWLGQTQYNWWGRAQVAGKIEPTLETGSAATHQSAAVQPAGKADEPETGPPPAGATQPAGTGQPESRAAEPQASPEPEVTEAQDEKAPTFDIVRVEPDGTAVIAGRAQPEAAVDVLVNGKSVGTATADSRGEWAVVVEKPLPSGSHNVTLQSEASGTRVEAVQSVAIALPDRKDEKPLIVLSKKGEASKILQAPEKVPEKIPEKDEESGESAEKAVAAVQPAPREVEKTAESADGTAGKKVSGGSGTPAVAIMPTALALKTVDYDDGGNMIFTGTAQPDETVRIYIDNKAIADAKVDGSGTWTLRVVKEIEPGNHNLRVDQLTSTSRVGARIELPFTRADPKTVVAALNLGTGAQSGPNADATGNAPPSPGGTSGAAQTTEGAAGAESATAASEDTSGTAAEAASAPAAYGGGNGLTGNAYPGTESGTTPPPSAAQLASQPEANVAVQASPVEPDSSSAAQTAEAPPAPSAEPAQKKAAAPAAAGPSTAPGNAQRARQAARTGTGTSSTPAAPATPENRPATAVTQHAAAPAGSGTGRKQPVETMPEPKSETAGDDGADMPAPPDRQAAAGQPVPAARATADDADDTDDATGQDTAVVQRVGRVIIQPGNNLWNISRVIYGSGLSYTTIYNANRNQIRNPDLIYPGQIFTTPGVVPPESIEPEHSDPMPDSG